MSDKMIQLCIVVFLVFLQDPVAAKRATTEEHLDLLDMPEFEHNLQYKREMIRRIAVDAWTQFEHDTFGDTFGLQNETLLREQETGQVVLGALSSFVVMDMPNEFAKARQWIANKFKFASLNQYLETNEVVVDMMGGLLSSYALTKDSLFLHKAKEISAILESVFEETNGFASYLLNPFKASQHRQTKKRRISKSSNNWELEYRFLANQTHEPVISNRAESIRQAEKTRFKLTGEPFDLSVIKSFMQSNGTDREAMHMFRAEVSRLWSTDQIVKSVCGLWFVRSQGDDEQTWGNNSMLYEKCNVGGLLALGHTVTQSINKTIITSLIETCQIAAEISETRLAPKVIFFQEVGINQNYSEQGNEFLLSPELAESFFILWRLTGRQRYRDYAWSMVKQIYSKCRNSTTHGYYTVKNVCNLNVQQGQPFYLLPHPRFLSATLKYLYLIFTDEHYFPLDQWVFNSAGHPFPVGHRLPSRSLLNLS